MLRNKGFRFDEYDKLYDYDMVINDNKVLDIPEWYIPGNYLDMLNDKFVEIYDRSYEYGFNEKWDILFSRATNI
jgi:hypothetical protein